MSARRRQPWPAGTPIPDVVTDAQLADILGYGETKFRALRKAGAFDFLHVAQQIEPGRPRYSGTKIRAFCDGTLAPPQQPGRRHYFLTHRRRVA